MSTFAAGHLAANPLPPGIVGSLGISGYQLLVDVAGVGAGRLGAQGFLLLAPEPDPTAPEAGTHLALHHARLRDEAEAGSIIALAGQLGLLRIGGYRLVGERNGLRSRIQVVNPATGAVALVVPDRPAARLFGRGGGGAGALLAAARALPPAGAAPDLANPQLLQDTLLALALSDHEVTGAQAPELAEHAMSLLREDPGLDPAGALARAKAES